MLKIKSLFVKNYSGFKGEVTLDFSRPDGNIKPINVFFGPNGCGKSTGLNAISVLSRAKQYAKRDKNETNLLLRKMQFHPDYDPSYQGFTKYSEEMEIKGVFLDGSKELLVHIKDDNVIQNDLLERGSDNCVYIDADHPINMNKFQVPSERIDLFLDLARTIFGYPCFAEKIVSSNGVEAVNNSVKSVLKSYADNYEKIKTEKVNTGLSVGEIYKEISKDASADKESFYQDFILQKGDVRVHHKSMSAGEKKIATLLRSLCDPTVIDKSDIVLIDNLELHVYFKRHKKMIDKLLSAFPSKQFIVTTHSGIMIDHVGKSYGHDCLFDISLIKGQPVTD